MILHFQTVDDYTVTERFDNLEAFQSGTGEEEYRVNGRHVSRKTYETILHHLMESSEPFTCA